MSSILNMHYSRKLKEKIVKLEADIYKIIDGNKLTVAEYQFNRNAQQSMDNWILYERSMKTGGSGIVPYLKHKSVYPGEHIST